MTTEGDATFNNVTGSGRIRALLAPKTPELASSASSSKRQTDRKKRRRSPFLTPIKNRKRMSSQVINILQDSGSDGEGKVDCDDNDDVPVYVNYKQQRKAARLLRSCIVIDQEDADNDDDVLGLDGEFLGSNQGQYIELSSEDEEESGRVFDVDVKCERMEIYKGKNPHLFHHLPANVRMEADDEMSGQQSSHFLPSAENVMEGAAGAGKFVWLEDFTSFTGWKEEYLRTPGPTFSAQDPSEIFSQIWDQEFMEIIVKETNNYASEVISQLSDPEISKGIPKYLDTWTEVTVEEMYRFFAMLILMSFCLRNKIQDYWETGIIGMPEFRDIMSRNRFLLINKFLHFVCNENLFTRGYDRKVEKVAPLVDHCNKKFRQLYIPSQYLSLDESLLLWKGRLSGKQSIRSKDARWGVKSFELCEAETGYLLQYRLYTGKSVNLHSRPLHGFKSHAAKVVLDLMEGYLNVGHVIIMDNWYNQLPLTRFLKSQRTDVLGTINRRRKGIPQVLKDLNPNQVERGVTVSRHSGDIALVTWKDVKLVTVISTYHQHEMVPGKRGKQVIQKPVAVMEYNRYMGGVNLKDQKLSMFLIERKRSQKWYMKVFRRLFNTSLLNAYILYTRNPMHRMYTHRQFRRNVAVGLLRRYSRVSFEPFTALNQAKLLRLQPGMHFPVHTKSESTPGKKAKHKQMRCVRCAAQKKRVAVTLMCRVCQVPLCVDQCWLDYHTRPQL